VQVSPLSIVWPCPLAVSAYLALGQQIEMGRHACPVCGQRLTGWGGYWRWIRGPGTEHVWIRRGRCASCRRSHALLPDFLLERRLDEVEVIGRGLALHVTGLSMRSVAEHLDVPMTTAREWQRRFQMRAPTLAATFVAIAVHLDPTAVPLTANGAPYANAALERSCAVLGIRLIHSRPYQPQGRGKQERLGRYIRERFLLEAEAQGISSFQELNDRFMAWAEQVCNTRQHAETGQTPIERFTSHGPLHAVEPSFLREALRWSIMRGVTQTASVSLAGNRYSVDHAPVGRRVELRFDPEDLTRMDVYWEGHPAGQAIPFILGRHVHRQVPQAQLPTPTPVRIQ
jgi:hypothetical protein